MSQIYTRQATLQPLSPTKTALKDNLPITEEADKADKALRVRYGQILSSQIKNAAQEVFQQNGADEKAFQTKWRKKGQEIYQTIPDDEMRFMAQTWGAVYGQTYATKAKINRQTLDNKALRWQIGQEIQSNLELMQVALTNMVQRPETADNDYGVYLKALSDNNILINQANSQGKSFFNLTQQQLLRRQTDKAKGQALRYALKNMTAFERSAFYQKLQDDAVVFHVAGDKVNLSDTVEPMTYARFKTFAHRVADKAGNFARQGLVDDEEAQDKALAQEMAADVFQTQWHQIGGNKKTPAAYQVLNFRENLQEAYQTGALDSKTYQKYLKESALALMKINRPKDGVFSWKSNLDVALQGLDLSDDSPDTPFKKDLLFKSLKKEGIQVDEPFTLQNYPKIQEILSLFNRYYQIQERP